MTTRPSLLALDGPDAELLRDFLEGGLDLSLLARRFELTPDDLIRWFNQPAVAQRLTILSELAHAAADLRAAQARQTSITALEHIARTAEDPIEKRRAATALLRLAARPPSQSEPKFDDKPLVPASAPTSRTAAARATPTAHDPPILRPEPSSPPQHEREDSDSFRGPSGSAGLHASLPSEASAGEALAHAPTTNSSIPSPAATPTSNPRAQPTDDAGPSDRVVVMHDIPDDFVPEYGVLYIHPATRPHIPADPHPPP